MIKPTLLRKLPLPLIAIFSALVFSQLPSVSARQAATPEESALLAAIETSLSPFQLANRQWVVDGVHVAHPWGIGALSLFDPVTAAPIPSSPQLVLAQMVGGSWQVALPFDPQQSNLYNQWLDQIPNDLIPSENKDALRRPTANKIAPAAVVSGYKLPWPGGQQAYLTSNAADHGYPSLDFNILGSPASGDVVAAKAGTVRFTKDSSTTQCTWNGSSWSCDWKYTNVVVIEHSSSEFSWYMHLAPGSIPSGIQPGTYVSQGTKIGVEGKTGWATGVHLHFQVATSYGCCSGSGVTQTPYWPTAFHEVNFLEYSWAAMQSYGWKDSQNFLNNCPGPNLSSPSDGYVSNNQSLTFDWSGPSGCTYQGYTFRVKDTPNMDSGGTTIFDEGQGGLSVTKTFAAQWHNRDLYWGVRTANPLSPNWSVRRFRIEPGSQPPGGSWNADYYDNIDRWWDNNNGAAWQCSESINGAFLDKNYAGAAPCNGMDPESWIGDYASTYDFPTGDYVFWLEHDDGAKLWVNGQNIQDRGGSGSGWVCPPRPLSGSTALRVMLREDGGDAKIKLNWTTNTAVCITPPAPPQLVAPSDGTVFLEGDPITLSWSATGDEYYGEWWGGPAGVLNFGWQADASIPLGAQWAGYTYYWRIKARSADGESNWSPTWTFQIKPAQPTNLSASPADCSAILLSWSDNSGSEAGYKVYRDGALLATLGSNATSYLDSGLTSNTAYAYYVRAYR
ncbi:MAG: peptidoglycan DD-metalloendopeptidase family protein, partial [Anaerolineae bacterium]|nr:peptidoglycan DD-metalloendopeptidase family protein [Anaerolineae bacterium]